MKPLTIYPDDIPDIEELCRYIIEFEKDDFKHHCDESNKNHIYYRAIKVLYGKDAAEVELENAINERS